jgi:hypothetical protein
MSNPLKQWKLSPMDLESITRWDDYSRAKDEMLVHTDTETSPWYVVEAEDKRRARLNMMHHLLQSVPWEPMPPRRFEMPERPEGHDYQRPPREVARSVPDHAATLLD